MISGSMNALTTGGTGSKDTELDSNVSQEKLILQYLRSGATLTPLEGLNLFGSLRLSARIHQLRKKHAIKTEMVVVANKKRVARYSL